MDFIWRRTNGIHEIYQSRFYTSNLDFSLARKIQGVMDLLIFLLGLIAVACRASLKESQCTHTWKGPSPGVWETPSNWNCTSNTELPCKLGAHIFFAEFFPQLSTGTRRRGIHFNIRSKFAQYSPSCISSI